MKKWLSIALAILLLWGCAPVTPAETTAPMETQTPAVTRPPETEPPITETQETEPLWAPGSVEEQTQGAIRGWEIPQSFQRIYRLGENILAAGGNSLYLLSGQDMCLLKAVELNCDMVFYKEILTVRDGFVGLYCNQDNTCQVLNGELEVVTRVEMPQNCIGSSVLVMQDMSGAYYTQENTLLHFDFATGEETVVAELQAAGLNLMGLLFSDTVAHCIVKTWNDQNFPTYLSVETGEVIAQDPEQYTYRSLESWQDQYLHLRWNMGAYTLMFGKMGQQPMDLALDIQDDSPAFYLWGEQNAVVGVSCAAENGEISLEMYSMTTGYRDAAVSFQPKYTEEVVDLLCDPNTATVWVVTCRTSDGKMMIYSWDAAKSRTGETQSYITPHYTEDSPDTEGIARCRQWADRLEAQYGVEIVLDGEGNAPDGYHFIWNYQVSALEKSLAQLEAQLTRYPAGMFTTVGEALSQDGKVHILLVGQMQFDGQQVSLLDQSYYAGGNLCIALVAGPIVYSRFHRAFAYTLDSYLADLLDGWNALNPEGFSYYYRPLQNTTEAAEYLDGAQAAFLESFCKISPQIDRATLMEYAMLEDAGMFLSPERIQAKLRLWCEAIREGFDLQDYADPLPWEQYVK